MKGIKKFSDTIIDILSKRLFWILVGFVLVLFLLKQCRETQSAKEEALREHNNYLASLDSVRVIKSDRDKAIFEKSSFQLKVSELTKEQKDLIEQLELAKNGRKTTPKTVVQVVVEYRDSIRNILSTINKDSSGQESINFVHNPTLPGKNKLKISGKIPYDLGVFRDPKDSSKYLASIKSGNVSLDLEQSIDIVTGIYQEPKSKRIMTRVSTTYPGLSFSEINSFDVTDNPETRKLMKKSRKEFGFGATVGWGISSNMRPGLILGIGLHYTPKFLQFGK